MHFGETQNGPIEDEIVHVMTGNSEEEMRVQPMNFMQVQKRIQLMMKLILSCRMVVFWLKIQIP